MFGMGPEKILLLAIVVLLLFGAKRIPEIGSSFGKGIREFKKSMGDIGGDDAGSRADLRAPHPIPIRLRLPRRTTRSGSRGDSANSAPCELRVDNLRSVSRIRAARQ